MFDCKLSNCVNDYYLFLFVIKTESIHAITLHSHDYTYGFLYIILQIEDLHYFWQHFLFIILGVIMFVKQNKNWKAI